MVLERLFLFNRLIFYFLRANFQFVDTPFHSANFQFVDPPPLIAIKVLQFYFAQLSVFRNFEILVFNLLTLLFSVKFWFVDPSHSKELKQKTLAIG